MRHNEGWQEVRLDDLAEVLNHKRIPLNSRERENRKGIYPYYGASGIVDYIDDYLFEGEHVLISEDGENLRSRKTPIAFKADGKFWVNNHAHILKGNTKILNDYIVYYFQNTDMSPFVTGAVQPKLNKENLLSIPIKIPPNGTLEKIVTILSAFDDKIELNRQMNQTLEEMAQALFREMCVPEEGELPEGWVWKTIGDIAENIRDTVDPTDLGVETNYIGLEHIPRKQIAIDNWGSAENISSTKYKFTRKQILFGKLRPYFHKVGIAPVDGVCSTDILVIEPKEHFFFSFLLMHCFSEELIASVDASSSGTRMPRTNWNAISRFKIALPPISVIKALNDKLKPFIQKMNQNTLENITHARLRDILLPEFMKGDLLEE